MINNQLVSDKGIIADNFNKFYINIGSSLSKKIQPSNINPSSYITKVITESIFLKQVNEAEILKIITSLKNSSPGHDDIHAKVVKQTCLSILDPLAHIFNLSILQGVFPNELN